MVILAMFRQPALLINYLSDLKWWLREWSVAINVTKITAVLFAKPSRHIPAPTLSAVRGASHFVSAFHYLGVTLDS
jgi:hypothetical protein